jgi:peroxiredoxin
MNERTIWLFGLVVASLSAFAGYKISGQRFDTSTHNSFDPSHIFVGSHPNGEIKILDLAGREHSLTEWKGKILVANFWATWCPPCVTEIPGFIVLQAEFGTRGVQFIGIALDERDKAENFSKRHGINYPILAGDDNVAQLMQDLGNAIGALPFTVIFDRDGKIAHVHQGEWSQHDARQTIEPLLGSTPPALQQTLAAPR